MKIPDIVVAYTHNVSDGGIRVHKLPRPGETVRALESGAGIDGAKGTNVAVAASRAGAAVALMAHVQGGEWFTRAQRILAEEHIDDSHVICEAGVRRVSGCMIIDDEGNNMIVLGSGTNQAIPPEEADKALEAFRGAKYCVTGYELAEKSAEHLLQAAGARGMRTVLNPSPVPETKPGFWGAVDVLVLNEVETAHMLVLAQLPHQPGDWEDCARKLRTAYGCKAVVITLGPAGFCALDTDGTTTRSAGVAVQAKDATGAGDGFLGAMVARLAAGDSLGAACRWANRYAALTVQHSGTISSYPFAAEVD